MAGKTILLIDCDLIAFRHSAATEGRSVDVIHKPTGRSKEFKTKTAFKDFLKNSNFEFIEDDYHFVPIQEPAPISVTKKNIDKMLSNLIEFTWCDSYELYLGYGDTFRHKLPLPTPYKNNRADVLKPINLGEIREWILSKNNSFLIHDGIHESDDFLSIRAYEELAKGNYPIIVTVDKDSYQAQGASVLDWSEDTWNTREVPNVGELHKVKTDVKGTGLKFLAQQILAGDAADTYQGYELSQVPYGKTKAMNKINPCTTEQEVFDIIISEYKRLYPDITTYTDCHGEKHDADWRHFMEMYFKCAYMKRSIDDPSDIYQFAESRGCKIES